MWWQAYISLQPLSLLSCHFLVIAAIPSVHSLLLRLFLLLLLLSLLLFVESVSLAEPNSFFFWPSSLLFRALSSNSVSYERPMLQQIVEIVTWRANNVESNKIILDSSLKQWKIAFLHGVLNRKCWVDSLDSCAEPISKVACWMAKCGLMKLQITCKHGRRQLE